MYICHTCVQSSVCDQKASKGMLSHRCKGHFGYTLNCPVKDYIQRGLKYDNVVNTSYITYNMTPETFESSYNVLYLVTKGQRQPNGQSRKVNPEKLATFGTQDTGQAQAKQKTQHRKLKMMSNMISREG